MCVPSRDPREWLERARDLHVRGRRLGCAARSPARVSRSGSTSRLPIANGHTREVVKPGSALQRLALHSVTSADDQQTRGPYHRDVPVHCLRDRGVDDWMIRGTISAGQRRLVTGGSFGVLSTPVANGTMSWPPAPHGTCGRPSRWTSLGQGGRCAARTCGTSQRGSDAPGSVQRGHERALDPPSECLVREASTLGEQILAFRRR